MSRTFALFLIIAAGCGSSLSNPVALSDCDAQLAAAAGKAGCVNAADGGAVGSDQVDCRKFGSACANATEFDGNDVAACASNIGAASNCEAGLAAVCSMHCQ